MYRVGFEVFRVFVSLGCEVSRGSKKMPKIGDAGVKTWQNHPTEITIKRNKTPPNLDLRFLEVQFCF